VCVTSNALTEASNLIEQHREPERAKLLFGLPALIQQSPETVVDRADAAEHAEFPRLGLSDVTLLKVISPMVPLLTVDSELYHAALKSGTEAALNFRHLRDL